MKNNLYDGASWLTVLFTIILVAAILSLGYYIRSLQKENHLENKTTYEYKVNAWNSDSDELAPYTSLIDSTVSPPVSKVLDDSAGVWNTYGIYKYDLYTWVKVMKLTDRPNPDTSAGSWKVWYIDDSLTGGQDGTDWE